ncbi:GNAT family N-acetyltransferase [Kineococcus gypseus]|uniref:GNAT family N-acetyltransferase n=1 Tax=Kineococcus gypseus TaxID=1637102 RepID=UPI003D7E7406
MSSTDGDRPDDSAQRDGREDGREDGRQPAARLAVTHDEAAQRYEGRLEGELVALADYVPRPGADGEEGAVLAFVHTEVVPEHQDEGLASALVDAALRDVRERGLKVLPACSFVRLHVRRHPERYADLL